MKKKITAVVLAAAFAASLMTGCGSSSSSSSSASSAATTADTTAATAETSAAAETTTAAAEETTTAATDTASTGSIPTLEDGVLNVGVEIGYPPMEYFDEDGSTMIGFDIEMATALAKDLGLEVKFNDTAWDGIFAGVDTDKYDVIISCVSYTDDRNDAYCLTKPYIENAPVLVVPNDSDITDVSELSGKSVGVQMETTADYLMQDQQSSGVDLDLHQYEKVMECFSDLLAGRLDAVCTDSVVASYYLGDAAKDYKTVWTSPTKEPIVMCLKKGNDELAKDLEGALDDLRADGTMDEIATKYFGTTDVLPQE